MVTADLGRDGGRVRVDCWPGSLRGRVRASTGVGLAGAGKEQVMLQGGDSVLRSRLLRGNGYSAVLV